MGDVREIEEGRRRRKAADQGEGRERARRIRKVKGFIEVHIAHIVEVSDKTLERIDGRERHSDPDSVLWLGRTYASPETLNHMDMYRKKPKGWDRNLQAAVRVVYLAKQAVSAEKAHSVGYPLDILGPNRWIYMNADEEVEALGQMTLRGSEGAERVVFDPVEFALTQLREDHSAGHPGWNSPGIWY